MSDKNKKTKNLENIKKDDQSIRNQYKFTKQDSNKVKKSKFELLAKKINDLAKLGEVNKLDPKNAQTALENFINKAIGNEANIKELSIIKKAIYDKVDQISEDSLYNDYSKTLKSDNYNDNDIKKAAIGDVISNKWMQIQGYIANNKDDILNAAENLKLFKAKNDGTNNLTEMQWKALLGISNVSKQTIQVKVNTNIKKEDEESNVEVSQDKQVKSVLSNEDKKLKQELFEKFKNIRKEKNKEVIDVIDNLNKSLKNSNDLIQKLFVNVNEDTIPITSDCSADMWNKIAQTSPLNVGCHLDNLIKSAIGACNSGKFNDNGILLKLTYTVMALNNKLSYAIQCINSLFTSLTSLYSKDIEIAKGGNKTWSNINKRIMFNYNISQGKVKFMDKDSWNKLSHFEKLKNNFKFSDFNQMPDRRLWRKFSVEEKEAFLKLRNEFRSKRLLEIAKLNEGKEVEAMTALDKFIYYEWRDKFGFECYLKDEIKKNFEDSNEDTIIINGLYDKCLLLEKKKLLFNVFFVNGIRKFTNGRTIPNVLEFLKNNGNLGFNRKNNLGKKRFNNKFIPHFKNYNNFQHFQNNFLNNANNFNNYLGKKKKRVNNMNSNVNMNDQVNQDNNMNLDENENF
jgi:hypothetical protein